MIKILSATKKEALNAGPKAKLDIVSILKNKYGNLIIEETVYLVNSRIGNIFNRLKVVIKNKFSKDILIIQHPLINNLDFLNLLPKKNSIILVHDLQGIRTNDSKLMKKEIKVLKKFSHIIAHNDKMKEYLIDNGIREENIYKIELFDYLVSDKKVENKTIDGIAFVGNLAKEKTPFIHQLDEDKMKFNLHLYGVGIDKDINNKIVYEGSFNPDELPLYINQKLGLVWDGNYDESDKDKSYKNYTKYNNPHKLSCYIASGIPVIVWEKAAVANFVKENNIGYVINNIYDINNLSFDDYETKKKNVIEISKKVRNGYYTNKVFDEILK